MRVCLPVDLASVDSDQIGMGEVLGELIDGGLAHEVGAAKDQDGWLSLLHQVLIYNKYFISYGSF